jgi:hypothetical protein
MRIGDGDKGRSYERRIHGRLFADWRRTRTRQGTTRPDKDEKHGPLMRAEGGLTLIFIKKPRDCVR